MTSDVTGKVTSWTSYDEWGNITHNAVLKCGQRELDLVKNYTGYEYDQVLGQYYAKNRMYDAGDKRFMAVDPVKGSTRNAQSMVQDTYVLNNPIMYVDPLGQMNYLTQSGILAQGILSGVQNNITESLAALPEMPQMLMELIEGVLYGEIDAIALAQAVGTNLFSNPAYLVNHVEVLYPKEKVTDQEVKRYGEALGNVAADIAMSMASGKAGQAVIDVLKQSERGKGILSIANKIDTDLSEFNKVECPKASGSNKDLLLDSLAGIEQGLRQREQQRDSIYVKIADALKKSHASRPSWKESEKQIGAKWYSNYATDTVFLMGAMGYAVPHNTKKRVPGSQVPDLYVPGHVVEVKNYDLRQNSSNLVSNIAQQYRDRIRFFPTHQQTYIIDVTGQQQTVDAALLKSVTQGIMGSTQMRAEIAYRVDNKLFFIP